MLDVKLGIQALNNLKKHSFSFQILCVFLYRVCLDALYIGIISPVYRYSYSGFYTRLLVLPYLISILAVLILAPFIAEINTRRTPSSMLVTILQYLYFIPLTSFYGCIGTVSPTFFVIAMAYWTALLAWQLCLPTLSLRQLPIRHVRQFFWGLTILASVFTLAVSWRYTGLRFTLDFINVYEIRADAAEYDMPTVVKYLLNAMPMILVVVLLYWLEHRKRLMAMIVSVVYLFLFSIAGDKSCFFMLFLALGIYYLYRPWMFRWLPILLIGVAVIEVLEHLALGTNWILSLFTRRMMYVPVAHSEAYYRFFSVNPVDLFCSGIMGKLSFQTGYIKDIPRTIAEFIGEYSMNANNGLLGDMFANLPPLLGILIMPLILVISFRLLDLAAVGQKDKIVIPFAVYFAITFINSSWSTTLLSHGMLLTCILLYLYPRDEKRSIGT